jgi:hypothetical protein
MGAIQDANAPQNKNVSLGSTPKDGEPSMPAENKTSDKLSEATTKADDRSTRPLTGEDIEKLLEADVRAYSPRRFFSLKR